MSAQVLAVEAIAKVIAAEPPTDEGARQIFDMLEATYREDAARVVSFMRDAMHSKTPEAAAIREALGLRWESASVPLSEDEEADAYRAWRLGHGRVVGEWLP